jgi:hypothetical protein
VLAYTAALSQLLEWFAQVQGVLDCVAATCAPADCQAAQLMQLAVMYVWVVHNVNFDW